MSKKPGWAIRIYEQGNRDKKIDYVSSFENYGNRVRDEIIVFEGIYGIGNYMLWFYDGALETYFELSSVDFELKLFMSGVKSLPYWHDHYRCIDISYNSNLNKYVIYAESLDTIKLKAKVKTLPMSSTTFDIPLNSYAVLYKMLQENGILFVNYDGNPHKDPKTGPLYKTVNVNQNWSLYDFIDYICSKAGYEWYLKNSTLWVAPVLKAFKNKRSWADVKPTETFFSKSAFFQKVNGNPRPLDVMSNWMNSYKCIWAKHIVGTSGGMSKGCFRKISSGTLPKELYFKSLEKGKEKENADFILSKNNEYSLFVTIGNVLQDNGDQKYIDSISVQENFDAQRESEPHSVKIDRGKKGTKSEVLQRKFNVSRMTPYADNNAGLLFPSVETTTSTPPNSVILNIDGREESAVNIGYLFGNGEPDFNIPLKNKKDFRFRLPGSDLDTRGGNIYWDDARQEWIINGRSLVLQNVGTDHDEIPSREYDEQYGISQIDMFSDGSIRLKTLTTELIVYHTGCIHMTENNDQFKLILDADTGTVTIDGSVAIKLGDSATLGVARLNDTTISNIALDAGFWAWLNAAAAVLAGLGVVVPTPTSLTSSINQASTKVSSE